MDGSREERIPVETFVEFLCLTDGLAPEKIVMKRFLFQGVDFSEDNPQNWGLYQVADSLFFGCTFPNSVSPTELVNRLDILEIL
jgi:hypothetical protein